MQLLYYQRRFCILYRLFMHLYDFCLTGLINEIS